MTSFLLSILFGLFTGSAKRNLDAAEAFETPPTNVAARRYRQVAFCSFVTASVLLLIAALIDSLANARMIGEVFGWSGIGCLQVSVLCGIRYGVVNRRVARKVGPRRSNRSTGAAVGRGI